MMLPNNPQEKLVRCTALRYAANKGSDRKHLALYFWRTLIEGSVRSSPPSKKEPESILWKIYIDAYERFLPLMRIG